MTYYANPSTMRILSTIQEPHTMPELAAALPDIPRRQIECAISNAVQRKAVTNLRAGEGRKCGGLYVVNESRIEPRFDELLRAWR